MNNTILQNLIDTYGNRIYAFALNNNKYLMIGYNSKSSPTLSDIELVTIENTDFIKVHHKEIASTKPAISYVELIPTEYIEMVGIMDEEFEKFRVDPLTFR